MNGRVPKVMEEEWPVLPSTLGAKPRLPETRNPHFWNIVSGHFAGMKSYHELEKFILTDHNEIVRRLPPLPLCWANRQQEHDQMDGMAMQDLPEDHPFSSAFPIRTRADGNCFANSLSRIVYGNEQHYVEMRVRLTIDAVVNKERYIDSVELQNGIISYIPSDNFVDKYLMYSLPASVDLTSGGHEDDLARQQRYEHLTFNLSRNGQWCNIWQFHQAANVLQSKVRCIFPKWRESERRMYNRVFVPLEVNVTSHSAETVHIMFCRTSQADRVPCHFVPVVQQRFAVHTPHLTVPRQVLSTNTQQPIIIDDICSPSKSIKPQPARRTHDVMKHTTKTVNIECSTPKRIKLEKSDGHTKVMDSLDDISVIDPIPSDTPRQVSFLHAESQTPSSRRKQLTPMHIMLNQGTESEQKTPASRRKQDNPSKVVHAETKKPQRKIIAKKKATARKNIFDESVNKAVPEEGFLPMMENIDDPKEQTNPGTRSTISGQCTLCHLNGKQMTKFVEANYEFSQETRDTVLCSQYRIVSIEGDELICKPCHNALEKGVTRRNWCFFKENHKAGQCTLCQISGKRLTKFDESKYELSQRMRDTILGSQYRVVDNDGDEVICGLCDKALQKGGKRRKWQYYKDTKGIARAKFLSALGEFPEYACTVCHRMQFPHSVNTFQSDLFDLNNKIVSQCLSEDIRIKSQNGTEYICFQCQRHLRRKEPEMPAQAVANNLEIPSQPDILKNLTALERRCIGLNIPFMSIQSVRQNGQRIKGPCVNVPASLEPICTLLPRLPEEMKTVLIKLKRRLEYDRSYIFDYIRPQVVMEALIWLKTHNPLYKDVNVNHQWFDEIEQSPDLYPNGENTDENDGKFERHADGNESDGSSCERDNHKSERLKKKLEEKLPEIKVEITTQDEAVNNEDSGNDVDADFEEEQRAANDKAKISVQPSSTCVQLENPEEAIFAIAPGENSKPKLILTDEQFELSCFPDYFPHGKGSFHCPERTTSLHLRRYVNQRILNVDGKFGSNLEYVFAMQYAVELKQLETDRNVFIRNHSYNQGPKLNASMLRDSSFMRQMVCNDHAYKFMRNVRGTPAYWKGKLYETLAMFNSLGKPTWFLTLSAAEHLWPEMIQAVGLRYNIRYSVEEAREMDSAKKGRLLQRNPVITVRIWKHRLEALFNGYIKNNDAMPLGKVGDFVIKIEFQARGSPHAHIILWIVDAPQIDIDDDNIVCEFIDQYSIGRIMKEWLQAPEDCTSEELSALVQRVQVHKHNPMCRPTTKAKCRHTFPKVPSFKTIVTRPDLYEKLTGEERKSNQAILAAVSAEIETDPSQTLADVCKKCSISEEKYTEILLESDPSRKVILQREPQDLFVNNYNPNILSLWKANMDLQYCVDTIKCINYLMSYVTKCEKGMSEMMMRVKEDFKDRSMQEQMKEISKTFTGKREVSIQESLYRVLSLPLCMKSKRDVFISGALSAKRDHIPKRREVIDAMDDEDRDVFEKNIHDRYEARPDKLESMCLADFGTMYTHKKEKPATRNERYIELKDDLGWMAKNSVQSLLRTHKPKKGSEDFFQYQLKLFFPYRKESELLGPYTCYAERYAEVVDVIEKNSEKYNIFQEELDEAFLQRAKMQQEENATANDWDMVNDVQDGQTTKSVLAKRFRTEAKKQGKMSEAEYIKKVRTSNSKQKELVLWCRNHVKKQIRTMKKGETPEGFKIVLTGAGGTGKSHVISLINHDVVDLFGRTNTIDPNDMFEEGRNPEKPTALLTAMTGTAAFNIDGATLHSVMLMYQKILAKEKSCVLQSQLHQLQLLTVDEFSMMGARMLSLLNNRCCFVKQNIREDLVIKQNRRNFGNINILLVGDPYQLPAVLQTPIYRPIKIDTLQDFQKPLWNDFNLHELTQIMRQKDRTFADLLSRLRVAPPAENSEDDNVLRSRELKLTFDDDLYPHKALHVFAQNDAAYVHNDQMLTRIKDKHLHISVANDSLESAYGTRKPTFSHKASETGNLLEVLKVKVGARVVLTNNLDVSDGLTNGAFGTVTCVLLNKDPNRESINTILVQFDSAEVGRAAKTKSMWKKYYPDSVPIGRTEANFPVRQGKMLHTASRQQFPLFLAWGVTIHKTQGMTLPEIVVDMDPKKGSYQKGQAYVACSRVTSLEGLHIKNYCVGQIKVEKDIDAEMETMRKQPIKPLPQPKLPGTSCDIRFAHLNIHGLMKRNIDKTDDMALDNVIQCVEVLCLSETHLDPSKNLTGDFWENFHIHRKDRNEKGGGVLVAVKKTLEIQIIEFPETNLEIVGVQIFCSEKQKTINVFCIYLPPMTNKAFAAEELSTIVEGFSSDMCVVTGDINEDLLAGGKSQVQSMLGSLGYTQHISGATSIYGSLLDHMYINCTCNHTVHAEVSEVYFSDHDIICAGIVFEEEIAEVSEEL